MVKRTKSNSNGSHPTRVKSDNGNGEGNRLGVTSPDLSNGTPTNSTKMGRPTKYKPDFPKQAAKLCKLGATDTELADFFEIDISNLYRWYCSRPDFRDAIKTPKHQADDRVERSLFMKATGFWVDTEKLFLLKDEFYDEDGKLISTSQRVHHEPTRDYYPPDTGAIAWWQKNRRPDLWRDKHEVDVSGKVENVFTLNIFEHDLSGSTKVIEGKKLVPRLRSGA